MKILRFFVSGQTITLSERTDIASGAEKYLYCKFDYSDEWSGADKAYRFIYSGKVYSSVENSDGLVPVPAEVIKPPYFVIAAGGYNGDSFIPTLGIQIKVYENAYGDKNADIDPGAEVTQGILAQMLALCTECKSALGDVTAAWEEQKEEWDGQFEQWETKFGNMVSNSVPVIGTNGNWHIYDNQKKAYTDSGKPARGKQGIQGMQGEQGIRGEKGDKGDTGEKGDKGDKGDTGAKGDKGDKGDKPIRGTDYWTEEDMAEISADLDSKISGKADAATTLAGYGIADAYTTQQTDELLAEKLSEIPNSSVTTDKIADNAVTSKKIAALSIITDNIKDDAITNVKIAPNAVTSSKINNKAITNEKVAEGAIDFDNLDSSLQTTINEKANSQNDYHGVEIGEGVCAFGGVAIGKNALTYDGVAVGKDARCLNEEHGYPQPINAVQIGTGTNSKPFTANIYDYELLADDSESPSVSDGQKYIKDVGKLNDLQTDSKSNIVSAVNEVKNGSETALETLKRMSVPHTTASGYPITLTDSLQGESVLECKVWGGKNLISYPYVDTTKTTAGVTYTDNGDGSITANGTTTEFGYFSFANITNVIDRTKKYILSGSSTPVSVYVTLSYKNKWKKDIKSTNGNPVIVDFPSYTDIEYDKITVNAYVPHSGDGTTVNNVTIKPQLELGTVATAYEVNKGLGDLKRIDGKYHIPVKICGKNLISYPYVDTTKTTAGVTYTDNGDGSITANGTTTANAYFTIGNITNRIDKTKTYILSGSATSVSVYVALYQENTWKKDFMSRNGNPIIIDFSSLTDIEYDEIRVHGFVSHKGGTTVNNVTIKPQLEIGTVATEYEVNASPSEADIVLNTPLSSGEYVDLIRKKRVNGNTETYITVTGELKTADSDVSNIICSTAVAPQKIEAEYYQDINKVIAELKNAILAQGGNT